MLVHAAASLTREDTHSRGSEAETTEDASWWLIHRLVLSWLPGIVQVHLPREWCHPHGLDHPTVMCPTDATTGQSAVGHSSFSAQTTPDRFKLLAEVNQDPVLYTLPSFSSLAELICKVLNDRLGKLVNLLCVGYPRCEYWPSAFEIQHFGVRILVGWWPWLPLKRKVFGKPTHVVHFCVL